MVNDIILCEPIPYLYQHYLLTFTVLAYDFLCKRIADFNLACMLFEKNISTNFYFMSNVLTINAVFLLMNTAACVLNRYLLGRCLLKLVFIRVLQLFFADSHDSES